MLKRPESLQTTPVWLINIVFNSIFDLILCLINVTFNAITQVNFNTERDEI